MCWPVKKQPQVLDLLRTDATRCYDHYAEMLNEDETGAPPIPRGRAWRANWRG